MARTIKIRLGDLKRILHEEALREAEGELEQPEEEEGSDSLDSQVDKYLGEYESEAKSAKTEGKDWRRTVRRIVEAGGDDEEDDKGDDDALGADEPAKAGTDDIDVDSFTNSVIRLIDNYDSLLEVRNTILRRAANFLNKNYETTVTESFKEKLRGEHGIEIGKSPEEASADEFQPPPAAQAGPLGGAGGAPP